MSNSGSKRGGWITSPFITGALVGLTLATGGWQGNLIVYLIQKFNVKRINAAQISNIMYGFTSLFPVIGAIVADSSLGSFVVASISVCISLLGGSFNTQILQTQNLLGHSISCLYVGSPLDGIYKHTVEEMKITNPMINGLGGWRGTINSLAAVPGHPIYEPAGIILLVLTATLDPLTPQPCGSGSSLCTPPSKVQYAVLYIGLALASIGSGGSGSLWQQWEQISSTNPALKPFSLTAVSNTAIIYVEDNVSWGLGFGLSAVTNFIGLAFLLLGNRFYVHDKPQGSPFTGLLRVIVATIRKRKLQLTSKMEDYFYGQDGSVGVAVPPKKSFRFLNRAALKTEGDVQSDGSIAKPWRICTLQQVEDLKTLLRIFPLWSSSMFLCIPIGIMTSLSVLQALAMDRHIGRHFRFPSGSIIVIILISTAISLTFIDRFLCPMWQKLTGLSLTPLQRIGIGHVLNILSMAVSALVESKRLKIAKAHNLQDLPGSIVPMLVLWLFPQLVLVGVGEAFHFPGQVSLYYQEFPTSLKSTATAMISLIIGIAYYLSTALIDLARRVTGWLPDNLNDGRLDNVYWALVVVGVINFGYYLVCARLFKYQNVGKGEDDAGSGHNEQ
ncbi:Protein NRT1/ PTR FAMILY 2.7 [Morella rubra]|uniref:Protein NRT1/ PTR FAMILY 2.7 n=1 Tax=Morella rubra TaxID=262757 RepID=A0A6A1WLC6_9ROSI|nr:Protein NRT1/ PTR FAMILY 2.7 [Morella rubra]